MGECWRMFNNSHTEVKRLQYREVQVVERKETISKALLQMADI